jgi:predicted MFS family arabinose efflux permease
VVHGGYSTAFLALGAIAAAAAVLCWLLLPETGGRRAPDLPAAPSPAIPAE